VCLARPRCLSVRNKTVIVTCQPRCSGSNQTRRSTRTRLSRKEGKVHRTGRNHIVNERLASPPTRNVYASHCPNVSDQLVSYTHAWKGMQSLTCLIHVAPCENGNQGHSHHGDAGSDGPHFEIQTLEPILLCRTRVNEKKPKAKFYRKGRRRCRQFRFLIHHRDTRVTF
jgi:hypothetical protein